MKRIGGKRNLRNQIIAQFPPMDEIRTYVEVFGGAGWVLFGKEIYPRQIEVFNDIEEELINLFKIVKYHADALQNELNWLIISRKNFADLKDIQNKKYLTDVQRAAIYFYINHFSFSANMKNFSSSPIDIELMINHLENVHKRLNRVVIECRHYKNILESYNKQDTLFYLDPPYYKSEHYYHAEFTLVEHMELKRQLEKINGKFILSYNNCSFIRNLYKDFKQIEVERVNQAGRKNIKGYKELIIKNY